MLLFIQQKTHLRDEILTKQRNIVFNAYVFLTQKQRKGGNKWNILWMPTQTRSKLVFLEPPGSQSFAMYS